jgi:hypothetical protein
VSERIGTRKVKTYSEFRAVCVVWHGYIDLHVVCRAPPLELGFAFDHIFYSSLVAFYCGFDPDERLDGCGEAIGHEFEFAVWWDERYSTIVFEARETDTLVEFDVFHLDGFPSSS